MCDLPSSQGIYTIAGSLARRPQSGNVVLWADPRPSVCPAGRRTTPVPPVRDAPGYTRCASTSSRDEGRSCPLGVELMARPPKGFRKSAGCQSPSESPASPTERSVLVDDIQTSAVNPSPRAARAQPIPAEPAPLDNDRPGPSAVQARLAHQGGVPIPSEALLPSSAAATTSSVRQARELSSSAALQGTPSSAKGHRALRVGRPFVTLEADQPHVVPGHRTLEVYLEPQIDDGNASTAPVQQTPAEGMEPAPTILDALRQGSALRARGPVVIPDPISVGLLSEPEAQWLFKL